METRTWTWLTSLVGDQSTAVAASYRHVAFLDQDESKCWTAEEMLAEPNKNVREVKQPVNQWTDINCWQVLYWKLW